jgi:hypothetical protein
MSHEDIEASVEEVRISKRVLVSTLKQMLLQREELLNAVASINTANLTVYKRLPDHASPASLLSA